MNPPINGNSSALRVVKLGGSLLTQAGTRNRLQRWIKSEAETGWRNVWVVGGGKWVDLIREFDHEHQLTSQHSHTASIAAMDLTARLVSGWYPDWQVVDSLTRLNSLVSVQPAARVKARDHVANLIWLPSMTLTEGELTLPESWDVTSDSIAAWLANRLKAVELVLLKSCDAGSARRDQWSDAGLVDAHFSHVAGDGLNVRWVNLAQGAADE